MKSVIGTFGKEEMPSMSLAVTETARPGELG